MSMDNWILSLWESLRHQIALPDQWQWAPVAGLGVLAIAGLMMMLRGARWAPGFAGVAFLAIGGLGGQFLGNAIGIPIWPAIVVGGLAGLFVGVWAFRLWQAVMLAACCIVAATSVYYVRTLEPEVRNWVAPSVQVAAAEFALPDAGTVVGEERPTAVQELTGLWNHLTANVDGFEGTIWDPRPDYRPRRTALRPLPAKPLPIALGRNARRGDHRRRRDRVAPAVQSRRLCVALGRRAARLGHRHRRLDRLGPAQLARRTQEIQEGWRSRRSNGQRLQTRDGLA